MSAIMKYNRGNAFEVKLEGKNTISLAEIFADNVGKMQVDAIMFSEKGRYGKSAFVVSGDYIVWLPKHMVKRCEEIVTDADCVEEIKSGAVAFEVLDYKDETGATRFSVKWVDNA